MDIYKKNTDFFYWLRAWTLKTNHAIQILVSPLASCVVSGKSLNLSEPQFFNVSWEQ